MSRRQGVLSRWRTLRQLPSAAGKRSSRSSRTRRARSAALFEKAFHFFQFNQEEYMSHYHKRTNVESTFSAIKRKFGDSRGEQDRYGDGQRSAVQAPLPQPDLPDSRARNARHRAGFLEG